MDARTAQAWAALATPFAVNSHRMVLKNNLKHDAGVLSMARTMMPNSAGSQFFIMHQAAPHLDGAYAAFGKIIQGMNVVDKIATVPTNRMDAPKLPQKIQSMTVELLVKPTRNRKNVKSYQKFFIKNT